MWLTFSVLCCENAALVVWLFYISLKKNGFNATNTAGKCPDVLLEIFGLVARTTAGNVSVFCFYVLLFC